MSLGIHWLDALIWGVLTFSILVVLHEGGHFLAARAFGVRVHEFMVGLPGPAVSFVGSTGTRFGVTAVPLGGYVRIAGMEPGPEDELLAAALRVVASADEPVGPRYLATALAVDLDRAVSLLHTLHDWGAVERAGSDEDLFVPALEPVAGEDDETRLARARAGTYRGLKTWQRVTMLSAGVLTNIVAAVLVLVVVLALAGNASPSLTIAETSAGAAQAGLRAGDTVLALDGVALGDFAELAAATARLAPGDVASITYIRDGEERIAKAVVSRSQDAEARPIVGIAPSFVYGPLPVGQAVSRSFMIVGLVFAAVVSFFRPDTFPVAVEGARSIIGASTEIARAVEAGPPDYAALVALLSLSLGVMNMLPIPPLDGGKVVMELVERLIGRPLKREVSLGFSTVGALLLFSLIGYLMYADVARIVNG